MWYRGKKHLNICKILGSISEFSSLRPSFNWKRSPVWRALNDIVRMDNIETWIPYDISGSTWIAALTHLTTDSIKLFIVLCGMLFNSRKGPYVADEWCYLGWVSWALCPARPTNARSVTNLDCRKLRYCFWLTTNSSNMQPCIILLKQLYDCLELEDHKKCLHAKRNSLKPSQTLLWIITLANLPLVQS